MVQGYSRKVRRTSKNKPARFDLRESFKNRQQRGALIGLSVHNKGSRADDKVFIKTPSILILFHVFKKDKVAPRSSR